MAELIRYKVAAARLGVTMALMALIANVGERVAQARGSISGVRAAEALSPLGLPSSLQTSFLKIELKLDSTLSSLEHKLSSDYLKLKTAESSFLKLKTANTTFLKIDDANTNFLKIDDANTSFLKIDSANTTFLKIDDAASEFLKINDAANEFLKIDAASGEFLKLGGTAANSSELGGLTPDAFIQGHGNVLTNELTGVGASPQSLFNQGGLSISAGAPDGAVLSLSYSGTDPLQYTESSDTSGTITPGTPTRVPLTSSQTTLQIFDSANPSIVWTLTVSTFSPQTGGETIVGQLLTGPA